MNWPIFFGLLFCNLTMSARAQEQPLPLSPQCEAPNSEIAANAPLPRLVAQLESGLPVRILAIGSSSTWGVGASSPRKAYPAQLREVFRTALKGVDASIVNRGVSGELAKATAERMRVEVANERPELVLWQVGTNDALAGISVDEFEQTVRSTIVWLKSINIDAVIVGLQYTPKFSRDAQYFAIRDALRKIAVEQNVLYIRRYAAMQFIALHSKVNLVSGDDLHMNDLGYRCMAEHIARGVTSSVFMRRRDRSRQGAAQ